MLKRFFSAAIALMLVSRSLAILPCRADNGDVTYRDVTYHGVEVNGGEVIRGADISSVISLENSGVVFRNSKGEPQDIFQTLKDAGVNYIRVRVWNDPSDGNGNTYGGGANDVNTAVKIAERCAKYDLKLLVDFHYSDFWADPSAQRVPKAWKNYDLSQKAEALKNFTRESLEKIKATGVTIGMVQIGNETLGGMCGETEWDRTTVLMKAGSEAVRKFDKNILIAVHFPNPAMEGNFEWISGVLDKAGLDYDVFASSYYPFWHGSLSNLTNQLQYISQKYNKYVMVAETSWVSSFDDYDGSKNTIWAGSELNDGSVYGVNVQGQIDSVTDVFQAVADVGPKGIGVFYWEPAWIKVGDDAGSNAVLWEKYGSGAGTTAAGAYTDWAGAPEGSAVDNQALFDQDGKPMDSLYVFEHIFSSAGKNLISNPGFENDGQTSSPSGWTIKNTTSGEYSKFEVNSEQTRTGKYAAHWYSPVDFKESRLTGEFTVSEDGNYTFSSYISGEKSSYVADVYVNGEWKCKDTGEVSGFGIWNTVKNKFYASAGDKVKVEFIINGWSGSYGSIDDCSLYQDAKNDKPQRDDRQDDPGKQHEEPLKGDVDQNGLLNVSDIVFFEKYLFGTENLNDELVFSQADINSDGKADIVDFILLKSLLSE